VKGQLYMMTNRDSQAEIKYLQAIRITRNLAHPDRAQPLSNLGNLYRKQGKYVQADMLYKEALQVREQTKETFYCGTLYTKLAVNSKDQRNYEEAEYYFKKALEINDMYLGRSHQYFLKVTIAGNKLIVRDCVN
jgi:tetratricopeptide (TPR) repeat protein